MAYSASFLAKIRNQTNRPNLRLVLDGVNYDDEVASISQITRSAGLQAGTVVVTVDNSAGTFNGRITDDTWDMQLAYIKMYFDGLAEYMNLFAGKVTKIEYQGAVARIYIRDHLEQMLNRPIGNWEEEEDYYSSSYNPADMAWSVLVDANYGNLDNTANSGNTDIDYTQWSAWKGDMTTANYSLEGQFQGELSIRDFLIRICELTDSYIWVDGDGKLSFCMHNGTSQPTGSENYTDDNIIPEDISNSPFLSIDIEHLRNHWTSWYGYDPTAEDPEDAATLALTEDSGSQSQYGVFKYVDMDRTIWHSDSTGHASYRAASIQRYADPRRIVSFEATMASWLEDIGHTVSVTNSLLGISSETMTIIEMVLLPDEGKTNLTLYWDWD